MQQSIAGPFDEQVRPDACIVRSEVKVGVDVEMLKDSCGGSCPVDIEMLVIVGKM